MAALADLDSFRARVGVADPGEDVALQAALDAASTRVREWCGRAFDVPTAATLHRVAAWDPYRLVLPAGLEIASTTGLVVATDDNDDGTAETTWTITTDFEVGPELGPSGIDRPYTELLAVGSLYWPTSGLRRRVHVTARWGWSAVPAPVELATLMVAADIWKSKDAGPSGVVGFGEFGAVRIGSNRLVADLLGPFVRRAFIGTGAR